MRPEIKPKCLIILSTALFCARAAAGQAQIEASGIGEVVVRGQRNTPKESGDNYTVKGSTSATKLDLKLKETPQSISTFTRQQMQDQNLQDLDSVLQEAPGITVLQDSITGMG
ncbi:TonB-dependent receptor plug domain-containing protein [Neisseria elongata]|jgi:Outer membrane receptor for ferric coprogen and ferric-rhodotorulic acid|nr:TonB-dependent receptor plug domain-containing protein [Neisseria elongata]